MIGQLDEGRQPDDQQRDAQRGQDGEDRGAGEVDLLAHGRDLGVERAHEM